MWFEEHRVAVCGIHASDPQISIADKMDVVWRNFCMWITQHTWTITGEYTPTDKKSHPNKDFPFPIFSEGAHDSFKRGWFRDAVIELRSPSNKKHFIQATTRQDK